MPMPSCGSMIWTRVRTTSGGREELTALFPSTVGKVFDEVFVSGPEQVGELEVIVAQGDAVEVQDELDQSAVIHRPLADLAVEVDAFEDILESVRVGVLYGSQCLVQPGADRFLRDA